jgi:hypothetical protein
MYGEILDDKIINPIFMNGVEEFLGFVFGNLRVVCQRNGKKYIRAHALYVMTESF